MRYFSVTAIALLVAGLASAGQCANQQAVVQQVVHGHQVQTVVQPVIQQVVAAPVVAHVVVPQVQQVVVAQPVVQHVQAVQVQHVQQVQAVQVQRVVQRQNAGNQVVQRGLINFNGGRGANVRQGGILNFSR